MKWEKIKEVSVLCVGDVMLDTFVYGIVERISPEAPVPVFKTHRQFSILGGAGNVVRNIEALGGKTVFLGLIGKDDVGKKVSQLLEELPSTTSLLFTEKERKTPHKTRFVCQGQQVLRVDEESIAEIQEATAKVLLEAYLSYLSSCQVVVLSDYAKGGLLSSFLCERLIEEACQRGIPVIVDPKGDNYRRYKGATLLTPNLKELKAMTQLPCHANEEIITAAHHLRIETGVVSVLITRGQDGMTFVNEKENHHIQAKAREVYDVSGAGDTVMATLALALATEESFFRAIELANKAAGIVVGKAGTAVVTPEELKNGFSFSNEKKIHTLEELLPLLAQWRRQNQRLGFTNGCFDLLHLGHLHILKESRKTCDRLIIGLNSDSSVKRLKGESRPVQSEETRASVLAALEVVDAVIIFDEDTPFNLISTILPDILVKGADYRIDQVVGADVVQAHGGQVVLIDLLPGNSTTSTLSRFKAVA